MLAFLGVGLFVIAVIYNEELRGAFVPIVVLAIACVLVGLFSNFGGYSEPVLQKEMELMPICEGENIYVISETNGTITVRHEKDKKYDEEKTTYALFSYTSDTELVVIEEGQRAAMLEYSQVPKQTPFSLALGKKKKTTTFFYVPESQIQYLEIEYAR